MIPTETSRVFVWSLPMARGRRKTREMQSQRPSPKRARKRLMMRRKRMEKTVKQTGMMRTKRMRMMKSWTRIVKGCQTGSIQLVRRQMHPARPLPAWTLGTRMAAKSHLQSRSQRPRPKQLPKQLPKQRQRQRLRQNRPRRRSLARRARKLRMWRMLRMLRMIWTLMGSLAMMMTMRRMMIRRNSRWWKQRRKQKKTMQSPRARSVRRPGPCLLKFYFLACPMFSVPPIFFQPGVCQDGGPEVAQAGWGRLLKGSHEACDVPRGWGQWEWLRCEVTSHE